MVSGLSLLSELIDKILEIKLVHLNFDYNRIFSFEQVTFFYINYM
jgi:hypothetical protein